MNLFFLLYNPGDYQSPARSYDPVVILESRDVDQSCIGENGIFFKGDGTAIHRLVLPGREVKPIRSIEYGMLFFNKQQRKVMHRSASDISDSLNAELDAQQWSAEQIEDLFPFIVIAEHEGGYSLYHFCDLANSGGIYINYVDLEGRGDSGLFETCKRLVDQGADRLLSVRASLNDNCWYTKWRPDMEMERKYTFNGVPDTWKLVTDLYAKLLNGEVPGFVPELDMEFQVFDYESHIYEVTKPEEQQGYISYIPQADGRMAVKRKWYKENAEIRKEEVCWDQPIDISNIGENAKEQCGSHIKKMPPFRRKRFDVNMESLKTGNIYGIYFDICTLVDNPEIKFSQCEVEYCRTRTLREMSLIIEEFEFLCEYTDKFLEESGVSYQQDLFSKLDFVKENCNKVSEVEA